MEPINCGYARILADGKVTIPIEVREKHKLQRGEIVQLVIEKITKG